MNSHQQKLAAAIEYLRTRNKYLPDQDCTFKPTSAMNTDVAATFAQIRKEAK
jgi:hypothetical protein